MSVYYRYRLRGDEESSSNGGLESRDDPLAASPNVPLDYTTTSMAHPTKSTIDPFGPNLPPPPDPNSASKVTLVGGILGGIIAVLIVGAIAYFFVSRTRRQRTEKEEKEPDTTLPLEKVVLPHIPDLVARPFEPPRESSVVVSLPPRINIDTSVKGRDSPLPSSSLSPARSNRHIQSPSTESTQRRSPLTCTPETASSSFLDLSQTPATESFLSDTHSQWRPDSPPPVPSKHSRQESEERVSEGSTRPLNIRSNPQARKGKPTPHRFSRVLHIRPLDHREPGTRSRTGSEEDAPPPAYSEPQWSFWDGGSPRRSRFGR